MEDQSYLLTIAQFKDQKKNCEKDLSKAINEIIDSFNFPFQISDLDIQRYGKYFEVVLYFDLQ